MKVSRLGRESDHASKCCKTVEGMEHHKTVWQFRFRHESSPPVIAISAKGVDISLVLKVVADSNIPANCIGIMLMLITLEHRSKKNDEVWHSCVQQQRRLGGVFKASALTPCPVLFYCPQLCRRAMRMWAAQF